MPARVWAFLVLAVAVVACAVLFAARIQQTTADKNLTEARVAAQIEIDVLLQERGLDGFVTSGRSEELRSYFAGERQLKTDLAAAIDASSDSAEELALLDRSRALARRWQASATEELALARAGKPASVHAVDERSDELIDRFMAANADYRALLESTRHREERQAELVPVWLICGLSVVFGVLGWLWLRHRQKARAILLTAAARQGRFAEAMLVSQSQEEAHAVLARHLEEAAAGSRVVILNRNNSADRLEATTQLPSGHRLLDPLEGSTPRSCLAVRLNRQFTRGGEGSDEVLACDLCGALDRPSTCEPLLVGGEVIGSVLVEHERPLDESARHVLAESVAQAAPVLANLRNLALAESRAATDALTGLPNRRAVDDTLKRMLAQAGRAGAPMSLVLIDLDHFKKINDTHGHERGDEVLAAFAALLADELRASDLAGRTGGEEFVVILPDTDRDGAVLLAEKVREALHGLRVRNVEGSVTASFGVATFPDDAGDPQTLLRVADRALYAAKRKGRDRVETATAAANGEVLVESARVNGAAGRAS